MSVSEQERFIEVFGEHVVPALRRARATVGAATGGSVR